MHIIAGVFVLCFLGMLFLGAVIDMFSSMNGWGFLAFLVLAFIYIDTRYPKRVRFLSRKSGKWSARNK